MAARNRGALILVFVILAMLGYSFWIGAQNRTDVTESSEQAD